MSGTGSSEVGASRLWSSPGDYRWTAAAVACSLATIVSFYGLVEGSRWTTTKFMVRVPLNERAFILRVYSNIRLTITASLEPAEWSQSTRIIGASRFHEHVGGGIMALHPLRAETDYDYLASGGSLPARQKAELILPYTGLLPIFAALALFSFRKMRRAVVRRLIAAGQCPQCRYDLRASPAKCPECGWEPPSNTPAAVHL